MQPKGVTNMQKWYYALVYGASSAFLIFGLSREVMSLPCDLHPQAMLFMIVGILMAGVAWIIFLMSSAHGCAMAFFGLAWCWSAWFLSLLDDVCGAGFFGFLSVALLSTYNYVKMVRRDYAAAEYASLAENFFSLFVIFLTASIFLSFYPLHPL